ncbi:MAG: 2-oxoglutarate and iron-dependent oxygenase domain-containing protein [Wenzhouxiangellaceae bacterium]
MTNTIPVFDLRDYETVGDSLQAEFVQAVGDGYQKYGFVGFTHHDVDETIVSQAYCAFRDFFALPDEIKAQYHLAGRGGSRGYTGFGVEQAKDHHVPDLKEFWHIGREVTGENPYPGILHDNVWPSEIPDFKTYGYQLYQQLDDLGRRILSILAQYLTLPADWFDDQIRWGNSILRPIHYPPLSEIHPGQVRAARHEDINLITLLLGSEEAGLEILDRNNNWHPVTTIPGTIVVNIGDMLQRLTNHRLPSTTHRVVNPPEARAGQARYSIPFFLHPNPDMPLGVLPQCIDADNPPRYQRAISANDYLLERLREIKLL